jgi:hypothetical protein
MDDVQDITTAIVASDWYHGPLTSADAGPRAGYQQRDYIAAPNDRTGLTDQGRAGLALISRAPQYGIIINCDWCIDAGNGVDTPSIGRDARGGSAYDSVFAAGTRARIEAILAAAGDRPPTLMLLSLEATHPQAVPFYLELGTWGRTQWPDITWAVNFLGAAQVQARYTPGYGSSGILLANSHDPQADIRNEDGVDAPIDTYRVTILGHRQSGRPYIGWYRAQGREPDPGAW